MPLLLAILVVAAAPRVTIKAGPLTLEVGSHRGGQLFHVVDQLSDWTLSCHQQYRQNLAPFSAQEEALLSSHAVIRNARGYGVLDHVFYPADDWRSALDAAVRDGKLTSAEADTERAVLIAFEPRLKTFLDDGQKSVDRAAAQLKKKAPDLEAFARKAARFTGTAKVEIPLYLVPSPGKGGGGGASAVLFVEVGTDADPFDVLVHEAWHAFVEGQRALLDATVKRPPGFERELLSEGLAHAISPGMFHSGPGDLLARKVKSDLNEKNPDARFRMYARDDRLALALRPLLAEALDDPQQTLATFLPRACDIYRAVESLGKGLDGPGRPGIFVFGPMVQVVADRAVTQRMDVTWRQHTDGYAKLARVQPGDHVVFMFTSADLQSDPPPQVTDLLPLPLPKIRAALAAGKTVEAEASRKQWNVLLLAAPDESGLATLSQRSPTLTRWWPVH